MTAPTGDPADAAMAGGLRRVVVATDFSKTSTAAVARGAQLALQHGAALCLLHALDEAAAQASTEQPLRKRLADDAAALASRLSIEVASHLEAGVPTRVIARFVGAHAGSLVVVGSRAEPALAGLGSTAAEVVRMPAAPTLVVRSNKRRPYRKILAAVDLREGSLRAAGLAVELFANAQHHLLYVLDPVLPIAPGVGEPAAAQLRARYQALHSQADLDLQALARQLSAHTAHGVRAVVADDVPARAILVAAANLGADCVVVGHHGHGPATDAELGSMAQHVIHSALSDVLVVP